MWLVGFTLHLSGVPEQEDQPRLQMEQQQTSAKRCAQRTVWEWSGGRDLCHVLSVQILLRRPHTPTQMMEATRLTCS